MRLTDFPQSHQSYIHRIGRTARAGLPGKAITFFSNEDTAHLRTVANVMRSSGCDVPDWMLAMKPPNKSEKRNLAKHGVKRANVGGSENDVGAETGKRKADSKKAKRKRVDNTEVKDA